MILNNKTVNFLTLQFWMAVVLILFCFQAYGQTTNRWTGIVDGSWTNATNWSGFSEPVESNNLYFGNSLFFSVTNDSAVTNYGTLIFDFTGYSIHGNQLEVAGINNIRGENTIYAPVLFNGANAFASASIGSVLTFEGAVTGNSGGAGFLSFLGGGVFNVNGLMTNNGGFYIGGNSLLVASNGFDSM